MPPLDAVLRALIVLSLAWIAASVLRRRAASLCALIWTMGLAAALALPALIAALPAWRIELPGETPAASVLVTPDQTSALDTADLRSTSAAAVVDGSQGGRRASLQRQVSPASILGDDVEAGASFDWTRAVTAVSLAVTLLLLVRLAIGYARLGSIARRARDLDDEEWLAAIDGVARELGVRNAVPARVSDAIGIPAVAGVARPVLLLPPDACDWPADVRRAVLLHELAHVGRRDGLAQLIDHAACAAYWFLPLVWLGARRAAALRERASDDLVLLAGVDPADYAGSLVRLARGAHGLDLPAAALAMARPSRLRERVIAILDPSLRRGATRRRVAAVVVTAAVGVTTTLAMVRPTVVSAAHVTDGSVEGTGAAAGSVRDTRAPLVSHSTTDHIATARQAASASGEQRSEPRQTAGFALCSSKIESSSTSINDGNDGRRRWNIDLSGDDCRVLLRAEGRIEFAPDFTDITSVSPGGFFRVDATDRGVRRQFEIEPRNGALARTWRIDGRDAPYDDAARAWVAAFLIELDRRTGIGVDVRLPHLLQQGGVAAVLAETGQIASDYVRVRYYTRLAKAATLSAADVTRILQQAASLTRSDHYAHQVIAGFAGAGVEDPRQREAVMTLIERMESDHYRAESIDVLLARGRPSAAEIDLLVRMVPPMTSDHYKTRTLTRVVRAGGLTPDHQAVLIGAAASIDSDHYAAEFLQTVAGEGALPAGARQPLVATISRIQSDHYAAAVLTSMLRRGNPALDAETVLQLVAGVQSDHYRADVLSALLAAPGERRERDLLGVVAAAAPMADHYESTVLRLVLTNRAVTDRVQAAVLDAAGKLSRSYADAVRRAAGR